MVEVPYEGVAAFFNLPQADEEEVELIPVHIPGDETELAVNPLPVITPGNTQIYIKMNICCKALFSLI